MTGPAPKRRRAVKPPVLPAERLGEVLGAMGSGGVGGGSSGSATVSHHPRGTVLAPPAEAVVDASPAVVSAVEAQTAQLVEIDALMASLSAELAGPPLGRDELAQKRLALATLEKRRAGVVASLKTVHAAELKGLNQARRVVVAVVDWLDGSVDGVEGAL